MAGAAGAAAVPFAFTAAADALEPACPFPDGGAIESDGALGFAGAAGGVVAAGAGGVETGAGAPGLPGPVAGVTVPVACTWPEPNAAAARAMVSAGSGCSPARGSRDRRSSSPTSGSYATGVAVAVR